MNEEKLARMLNDLASPVDETGDLAEIRRRATSQLPRRSALRLVAGGAVVVLLAVLLYGGWQALRPEPQLVLTDEQGSVGSPQDATGSTALGAPTSASKLIERAQATLANLGPVRITITKTSQGTEGGREHSDTTTIEQLVDLEAHRGLQVTTRSSGEVERVSLDGAVQTNYASSPVSYGTRVHVEPPSKMPFPMAGEYEEALANLSDAEMEALPGGGWRLTETRTPPEEPESQGGEQLLFTKAEYALEIGPDYLPRRMSVQLEGEGGLSLNAEWTYRFQQIPPPTSEQVEIEAPEDAVLSGTTYDLPLDAPRSPHATWGQYWLGTEILGRKLIKATHSVFEPDPDYEPRQEGVQMMYDDTDQDDNANIQLRVMPPDGNEAKSARSRHEQAKPEERDVAGKPAEIFAQRPLSYEIFLPDAYITLQVWGVPEEQQDEVLDALRPVER
jgi:hypothetical protein